MFTQYAPYAFIVVIIMLALLGMSIVRKSSDKKTRYEELAQTSTYIFGVFPQLVLGIAFFIVVLGMLTLADHATGGTISRLIASQF